MQPTTFHSLYESYAGDILRFARFLTRSDDAAADITSETFLRAWAGRDTIRVTTARAYVFTIARNRDPRTATGIYRLHGNLTVGALT